jgi:hypothetical protein
MPALSLLIGLAQSLPHCIVLGPFLQTYPLATLYNPSKSLLITSALKMETACFSEMLISTNQSTQHLNPKDHHPNGHHHENLKSYNYKMTLIEDDPSLCTEKF